jgi:hypothetical protein
MMNTASRLPNEPGDHKHSKGQGEAVEHGQLTVQDNLDIRTSGQLQGLKSHVSFKYPSRNSLLTEEHLQLTAIHHSIA